MILHMQPNGWSCLPVSFGMCLNIHPKDMFRLIGHDGSQILNDLPEPYCRRAFHIQECIDICIQQLQFPVEIHAEWIIEVQDRIHKLVVPENRFMSYLALHTGVLVGQHNKKEHAVAWDRESQKCFDPCGYKYEISEFDASMFYALC